MVKDDTLQVLWLYKNEDHDKACNKLLKEQYTGSTDGPDPMSHDEAFQVMHLFVVNCFPPAFEGFGGDKFDDFKISRRGRDFRCRVRSRRR